MSCQILNQASSGIDISSVTPKVAAKYMTNSIAEYNKRMPQRTWKIQGRNHTTLMALCQATPVVISMLEHHYSTVRHSEGALTLEQLGYCDWVVGSSRIPEGVMDAPALWKSIMNVTADAMEEFAGILACVEQHGMCAQSNKLSSQPNLVTTRCAEPSWTSAARSGLRALSKKLSSARRWRGQLSWI